MDNNYGYKKGDLLRWTDLVKGESYVGLYLYPIDGYRTQDARSGGRDIVVLIGDKKVVWSGWQCEKLSRTGEWEL